MPVGLGHRRLGNLFWRYSSVTCYPQEVPKGTVAYWVLLCLCMVLYFRTTELKNLLVPKIFNNAPLRMIRRKENWDSWVPNSHCAPLIVCEGAWVSPVASVHTSAPTMWGGCDDAPLWESGKASMLKSVLERNQMRKCCWRSLCPTRMMRVDLHTPQGGHPPDKSMDEHIQQPQSWPRLVAHFRVAHHKARLPCWPSVSVQPLLNALPSRPLQH